MDPQVSVDLTGQTGPAQVRAEIVIFQHRRIFCATQEGKHYIALNPVCKNLHLDWSGQYRRIQRDEKFSSTIAIMTIVDDNHRHREFVCLPLEAFPGWLYTIQTSRIRDAKYRELLRKYQQECTRVLYDHFLNRTHRLDADLTKLENKVDLLTDNFSREFVINKHRKIFFDNERVYYQAQWFWRLFHHFGCKLGPVADHTGLFCGTVNRYIKRYQFYLDNTTEQRKNWSDSLYDDVLPQTLAAWYSAAGIDFPELFLRNDPSLRNVLKVAAIHAAFRSRSLLPEPKRITPLSGIKNL